MPRVCLTEEQKRQAAIKDYCKGFSKEFLDKLNSMRGKSRKTKADFCKSIGISPVTFWRWDTQDELLNAELGKVLAAAKSAGLVIRIEEAGA